MRERHPIDDRFRSLYDAEAAPPERVRMAIGHQLGWDRSMASGSASLISSALLLIGGAATAFALYQWNAEATSQEMPELVATEVVTTDMRISTSTAIVVQDGQAEGSTGPGATAMDAEGASVRTSPDRSSISAGGAPRGRTVPTDSQEEAEGRITPLGAGHSDSGNDRSLPVRSTVMKEVDTDPTRDGGIVSNNAPDPTDAAHAGSALDHRYEDGARTTAPFGLAVRPDRMDVLLPDQARDMTDSAPLRSQAYPEYVMGPGEWWLGAYAGFGSVRGTWNGDDAASLRTTETWKSSTQMGLLAGRQWWSGWSIGMGVGVARVRSAFKHDQRTVVGETLDLDTTWVTRPYPNSTDLISTWSVDTSYFPIAGPPRRIDAKNEYRVLQVPLLAAWHGHVARWKLGATAGLTGWFPMERSGSTLERIAPDADPTVTDLSDGAVDERYPIQVHGNVGLSLGYLITEHFAILAEPTLSTPVYRGGTGTTLSLTRPTLQIRLHYALRSRPH